MSGTRDIDDEASLLRRVHPTQVVQDGSGQTIVSSGAFTDPELSVDVEDFLTAAGLDWTYSLKDYSEHSLVRFLAKSAREKAQNVLHCPEPTNPYHVEVRGNKTQSVTKALKRASSWVKVV